MRPGSTSSVQGAARPRVVRARATPPAGDLDRIDEIGPDRLGTRRDASSRSIAGTVARGAAMVPSIALTLLSLRIPFDSLEPLVPELLEERPQPGEPLRRAR